MPGQLTGLGVIGYQRRLIGQSIAAEDYSSQMWTTGAIPDGVLTTDADLSPEEADEFKRRWTEKMGGRQRSPAVLSGGMTYKPIGWSNVDLEQLESRKWNSISVAQAFGVPSVFAMTPSSESKTYQNVQQDYENFVKGTLRGWLSRLESTFTQHLPRGQHVEFNLDALLRADTKTRYEAHAVGLSNGFLTVDEVRELERRPPLPTPAIEPEDDPDE
jgi:HK97 family phage portal protein